MNVTFRGYSEKLASTRLRAIIPAQQLHCMGVQVGGNDWLVIAKHGWDYEEQTRGFKRICFDICDDWFDHPDHGPHYRECAKRANLVTCSTPTLAQIIKRETGVDAVVIPEPFEGPEGDARCHGRLLWFGFKRNLCDLAPVLQSLEKWEKEIVSDFDGPGITRWSPAAMDEAWKRAGLTIIPTGVSMAKSNNRAVASLRRGVFPICGVLPSYAELGVWQGNIAEGVEWALTHERHVVDRIRMMQGYIHKEFSPVRIAGLWRKALEL